MQPFHFKMIPQQCCTKFKESTNVLLLPSLQTQIQLCSWKWREQALILGKTTIIPLSIAFTLVYLALLVCFCTATWQYDTFTFWLETYLPKHLVGKQKTMTALQQRKNNLYCRNQRRRWKVKLKERKTRKKRRQWLVEEKRLGTKKWQNKKRYDPGGQQIEILAQSFGGVALKVNGLRDRSRFYVINIKIKEQV